MKHRFEAAGVSIVVDAQWQSDGGSEFEASVIEAAERILRDAAKGNEDPDLGRRMRAAAKELGALRRRWWTK